MKNILRVPTKTLKTVALTLVAFSLVAVPTALAQEGSGFVPLTSLPGLDDVTSSNSIASFLNNLYKISIGAAAVLAVLQITRAGLMYMTEESIAEKKEARHLITMSILGLVLVLSPALVFGIIDPRILELNVDVSQIRPTTGAGTGNAPGTQQGDATDSTSTTDSATDTTDTTDPEGTPSEDECPPGQIGNSISDGTVECVPDENATDGGGASEQIVVRVRPQASESQGYVFVSYVFGPPTGYSCPPIGEGACGYTTVAGPSCSYVSFVYHGGTEDRSRQSCQNDPAALRAGGGVLVNCEVKTVPQDLRFNVPTPRCSGQPQFNP